MPTRNATHDSIAESMDALRIADNDSINRSQQPTLQEALEALANLDKAVAFLHQHIGLFQTVSPDRNAGHEVDHTDLLSLRKTFTSIAKSGHLAVNSVDQSLIRSIVSLGGDKDHDVLNLLRHFDERIREIVRIKLDETDDDTLNPVTDIVMECHSEIFRFGKLDPHYYFISRQHADPDWLYHSDSTRYTLAYEDFTRKERMEYDTARRRQIETQWRNFWLQALRNLPGTPTLFDLNDNNMGFQDIPRYMFRAYDAKSSGMFTRSILASCQSENSPEDSSIDVLSFPPHKAAALIYDHLNKRCFGGEPSDNFVSWSSSFIFVIQYAIWRSEIGHTPASDVQICVLDTREFTQGQFAKDTWLLRKYRDSALDSRQRAFFDFRLGRKEYDNGEYLSQGTINLGDKACVFSLQDLMSAGLCNLYPQFEEVQSPVVQWTNRVLTLRSLWSQADRINNVDFWQARHIARKLFKKFDVMDMALLLLSFRNYKTTWGVPQGDVHGGEDDAEPAEVYRYTKWADIWETCYKGSEPNEFFEDFFM
ncbi:hypothetical protein ACHAQI_004584 [Fusarium lateritium]